MKKRGALLLVALAAPAFFIFQNCSPVSSSENGSNFSFRTRAWTGIKLIGVPGAQTKANHLSVDPLGGVYSVGTTNGKVDPQSAASVGAFVARFEKGGNREWVRLVGLDQYETEGLGAASDATHVYIVGWTNAGLAGSLQGNIDLFLAKFGAAGDRKWIKQYGTVGATAQGLKVIVDQASNIVVVGFVMGQLEGALAVGDQDLFIMKFDSSGNKKWVRQYGVAGKVTAANAVVVDSADSIYIAGYTTGGFDGNPIIGSPDALIAKFDLNGNKVWSQHLGAPGAQSIATAVAIDPVGNVFVTGTTTGALEGNLKTGLSDTFVAKFQIDGQRNFVKQTGFQGTHAQSFGIATDRQSHVYLAGNNIGDPATTFNVAYLMKYDSVGAKIWTKQLSAPGGHVLGTGVATDKSQNVFFSGQTDRSLENTPTTGVTDSFVVKYDAKGVRQ